MVLRSAVADQARGNASTVTHPDPGVTTAVVKFELKTGDHCCREERRDAASRAALRGQRHQIIQAILSGHEPFAKRVGIHRNSTVTRSSRFSTPAFHAVPKVLVASVAPSRGASVHPRHTTCNINSAFDSLTSSLSFPLNSNTSCLVGLPHKSDDKQ